MFSYRLPIIVILTSFNFAHYYKPFSKSSWLHVRYITFIRRGILILRASEAAACIVIGPVCVFVCVFVGVCLFVGLLP